MAKSINIFYRVHSDSYCEQWPTVGGWLRAKQSRVYILTKRNHLHLHVHSQIRSITHVNLTLIIIQTHSQTHPLVFNFHYNIHCSSIFIMNGTCTEKWVYILQFVLLFQLVNHFWNSCLCRRPGSSDYRLYQNNIDHMKCTAILVSTFVIAHIIVTLIAWSQLYQSCRLIVQLKLHGLEGTCDIFGFIKSYQCTSNIAKCPLFTFVFFTLVLTQH